MSILPVIGASIMFVGIICVMYQIYQITVIDASSRGLKHPKLLGLFAMSGNNSSGLILYLIGRRKYPVINISKEDKEEIEKRKKAAGIGLIFLAAGAIIAAASASFM